MSSLVLVFVLVAAGFLVVPVVWVKYGRRWGVGLLVAIVLVLVFPWGGLR